MPKAEIEDWFEETPSPATYDLTMFESGGGSIQEISLAREEYISLKTYLGSVRGFDYEGQLERVKQDHSDHQQAAFLVDNAREALASYPALVLSPQFPAELQEFLRLTGEDEPKLAATPEDEKGKANRLHLLNYIRESVSDRNVENVLVFAEAIERYSGSNTPAEEFVCEIVSTVPDGLTPEDVRTALEQFEENFVGIQSDAVYLNRFYPELAEKAAEAGKLAR